VQTLKKYRPKITPLKIGVGIILLIVTWVLIQLAVQSFRNSVFFDLIVVCFLGFGFLIISWLLKYG
jgi:hypothetical protein